MRNHLNKISSMLIASLLSIVIGIICGLMIFLYKFGANEVLELGKTIYSYLRNNLIFVIVLVIAIVIASYVVCLLIKFAPDARGGGIPTSEGFAKGLIKVSWIKTLPCLIASSYISFLFGLPLGIEGPSVEIGACVGGAVANPSMKKKVAYERYAITSGAASAFACATGAPISGILFALEEMHKKFTKMLFLCAVCAVASGVTVMVVLCELLDCDFKLFNDITSSVIRLKHYGLLLIFGIIIGLAAFLFNKLIHYSQVLHDKVLKRVPVFVKILISFLLTAICGLVLIDTLGGGHSLIDSILDKKYGIGMLVILFLIKALLIAFVSQSGATGGLFIPSLLMGALTGAIFAKALDCIGTMQYYNFFVAVGMASFMASVVGCPLSGMAFSIEALGMHNNIIPVVIVVTLAYITALIFGLEPMYDAVLERKLRKDYANRKYQIIDLNLEVREGSFADGLQLRELILPSNCIISGVKRGDKHHYKMDNNGEKAINSGDIISLRVQTYDLDDTKEDLESIVGKQKSFNYVVFQEKLVKGE